MAAVYKPTLDMLLNELLHKIAEYVQEPEPPRRNVQKTFQALAGSNKRLRSFFVPFLYKEPVITSPAEARCFIPSLTLETATYVEKLDVFEFEVPELLKALEMCEKNLRKIIGISPERHLKFLYKYLPFRLRMERLVLQSVEELGMICEMRLDAASRSYYDGLYGGATGGTAETDEYQERSAGNGSYMDECGDSNGDLTWGGRIDPLTLRGFSMVLNCCPSLKKFDYDGFSQGFWANYVWDRSVFKRLPKNKIEHINFWRNSLMAPVQTIARMFENQTSSLQHLSLRVGGVLIGRVPGGYVPTPEDYEQDIISASRAPGLEQYKALRTLELSVNGYFMLADHMKELPALTDLLISDRFTTPVRPYAIDIPIEQLQTQLPSRITKLRLHLPMRTDLSFFGRIATLFPELQYLEIKVVEWTPPEGSPGNWRILLMSNIKETFSGFMKFPRGVVAEILARIVDATTGSTKIFDVEVNLGPVRMRENGTLSRPFHVSDLREISWGHWESGSGDLF